MARQAARAVCLGMIGTAVMLTAAVSAPLRAEGAAPKLQYDAQVYAGALSLNNGYKDRAYGGVLFDVYPGDVGIHGDFVTVDREERATYASLGLSLPITPNVRPKVMLGTSTDNRGILPQFFGMFEVQIKPGTDSGWIVTPAVAYRTYRNGSQETRGSIALVKYFTIPGDTGGYYAAQAVGSIADTGQGPLRGSFVAGLQAVRKSGFSLGLTGEVGGIVSTPLVENRINGTYYALRPNAGIALFAHSELLLRGEYSKNDAYRAIGGTAGLKFGL